ncbi:MAG: hypothetical protein GTO43_04875 [Armatimonadetes bacterium]|nr:hypothetical protein [Armatimonadota bacterium]
MDPQVEIRLGETTVPVGGTLTVVGRPVEIGLPYFYLYIDSTKIAKATYNGEVSLREMPERAFEIIAVSSTISQVEITLRALTAGSFHVCIGATGEIRSNDGVIWGGGFSESVPVAVLGQ